MKKNGQGQWLVGQGDEEHRNQSFIFLTDQRNHHVLLRERSATAMRDTTGQ